jgi:hypothetical protein
MRDLYEMLEYENGTIQANVDYNKWMNAQIESGNYLEIVEKNRQPIIDTLRNDAKQMYDTSMRIPRFRPSIQS